MTVMEVIEGLVRMAREREELIEDLQQHKERIRRLETANAMLQDELERFGKTPREKTP